VGLPCDLGEILLRIMAMGRDDWTLRTEPLPSFLSPAGRNRLRIWNRSMIDPGRRCPQTLRR
jgi:hypothetical protein